MYSDRRVIPLLQEIGVAEANGEVIFYRKLLNSRFCACAVKICQKLAYHVHHHHHHTNIISVVQQTASRTLNKVKQRDANATVWQSRQGPRKKERF